MSLKFEHPPLMVRKVDRIITLIRDELPATPGTSQKTGRQVRDVNVAARDEMARSMTGMAFGYLTQIADPGSKIREPSGRVMKNLGIEIWVKDKETGEMEQVDFFGRCEIDFTDPAKPKLIEE